MTQNLILTARELRCLKDLREICIDEDLLDLSGGDSISRNNVISNAWEALKVIERILKGSTPTDGRTT